MIENDEIWRLWESKKDELRSVWREMSSPIEVRSFRIPRPKKSSVRIFSIPVSDRQSISVRSFYFETSHFFNSVSNSSFLSKNEATNGEANAKTQELLASEQLLPENVNSANLSNEGSGLETDESVVYPEGELFGGERDALSLGDSEFSSGENDEENGGENSLLKNTLSENVLSENGLTENGLTENGLGENGNDVAFSESGMLPKTTTRIKIPEDAIKIEDRLNYILQPPLEMLLNRSCLEMPFEPFPYQKQGIAFLYSAHFAVLADEMGLGKTMQAITTIRLLLRAGECRRILLVCPKPLVTNWKREFELWAPEINVQVIEGKTERRKWLWEIDDIPVRIANYELLHRDREYYDLASNLEIQSSDEKDSGANGWGAKGWGVKSWETKGLGESGRAAPMFDLVVLDESQRIKNRSSVTSEAARAIPRRRSWALTGTPVENSAEDLVSIFEFLSPGYLESGLKPSQMCEVVGEHILRRTKDKVMTDLPPKLIRDAHIELRGEQWETYRMAQEEGEMRLNEMGDSLTVQHAFELIIRLKQICNFDPVTGESAKLERLVADLEEVAQSGRKAIIFSQWVQTLSALKGHLKDFHPVEYHGKIPSSKRDGILKKFKEDPDCHVILMSYGAGSVGLNLQFAGYVFLFDRWWNPAIEDQAINRAHRIGASGPVTVSRFVSLHTIEEKIDQILQQKRLLSEAILSGARGLNYSCGLNQADIFGLFNLKVPQKTPKKAA